MLYKPVPGLLHDAIYVCLAQANDAKYLSATPGHPDIHGYILAHPVTMPPVVQYLFSQASGRFFYSFLLEKGMLLFCNEPELLLEWLGHLSGQQLMERLFQHLQTEYKLVDAPARLNDPVQVARFINGLDFYSAEQRYALLLTYSAPQDAVKQLTETFRQAVRVAAGLRKRFAEFEAAKIREYGSTEYLYSWLEEENPATLYERWELEDPRRPLYYSLSFINPGLVFTSNTRERILFVFGVQARETYMQERRPKVTLQRIGLAFADPNRLEIVGLLRKRSHYGAELAQALGIAPNNLTYHLQILTECGVIHWARRGRRTCYELNALFFKSASDCFLQLYHEISHRLAGQPFPPEA